MKSEVPKFSGERPYNYETYLGPFLFDPYARDLSERLPLTDHTESVLEIACGTGIVTRYLRDKLRPNIALMATDLSGDMLAIARKKLSHNGQIEFREADIHDLPFPDQSFDIVVCQFGMMFLQDLQKGFNEVYRVLKPGGSFLFNTWDRTENMDIFRLVLNETILPFFKGEDKSKFPAFSLHDENIIRQSLSNAGFKKSEIEKVALDGIAENPKQIVNGLLLKHPLGKEIADRDPHALEPMARKLEKEIERRFSPGRVVCSLAAFVSKGIK